MMASLFGCGGGGGGADDPADAERVAAQTRSAAQETFDAIGRGVEVLGYTSTGAGRWVICGMEPSPNGAQYVAEIAVTQSNVPPSQYGDVVREQAEAQGWTVEQAAGDTHLTILGALSRTLVNPQFRSELSGAGPDRAYELLATVQ